MDTTAEKLVKYCIKTISKNQELDYSELKNDCKKVLKMSKMFDQQLMGMMEELLDLGNVGSEEELDDFDMNTLKVYCRIKELDDSVSDKKIKSSVWKNIQEEFELNESESEDDPEGGETESESEGEPEPEPEKVKVKKKVVSDS